MAKRTRGRTRPGQRAPLQRSTARPLAAVEPEIRKELLEGVADDQAKTRMGLLSTAFLVSYMLLAPVFALLLGASACALVVLGVVVVRNHRGVSSV